MAGKKLAYGAGTAVSIDTRAPPASRELQALLTGVVRKLNAAYDVDPIASADATDDATVWALANEIKTKLNLLLEAMKA